MRQNLTGKYHLKISPTLRTHQNKFWGWRKWQSLSLLEFCLHWEGWLRGVFHSRYQHPSICNGLPLLLYFSPFIKSTDCSHFLLLEPTQKAASCNNNCFCYMFSISGGHVGHDYSEFFVGRHVLDMIFFHELYGAFVLILDCFLLVYWSTPGNIIWEQWTVAIFYLGIFEHHSIWNYLGILCRQYCRGEVPYITAFELAYVIWHMWMENSRLHAHKNFPWMDNLRMTSFCWNFKILISTSVTLYSFLWRFCWWDKHNHVSVCM